MLMVIMDMEGTQMDNGNRFLRNKDLIPQEKLDVIELIGLGGIGSSIISLLTLMGFKTIKIWDYDKLEEHNLSTSVYPEQYLGQHKTDAAEQTAKLFNSDVNIIPMTGKFKYGQPIASKVIVCPDNMDARIDAYEQWKMSWGNSQAVSHKDNDAFFIDCRMDALAMELVTVNVNNDNYMDHFKNDEEIEDAPCTMKHTIFTSSIIAGHAVGQVFNLLVKNPWYDYIWIGLLPFQVKKSKINLT